MSYLRPYPLQIAAGFAYQRFDARNPPALPARRGSRLLRLQRARVGIYRPVLAKCHGTARFIAIKTTDPVTGTRVLVPGGVTNADLGSSGTGTAAAA